MSQAIRVTGVSPVGLHCMVGEKQGVSEQQLRHTVVYSTEDSKKGCHETVQRVLEGIRQEMVGWQEVTRDDYGVPRGALVRATQKGEDLTGMRQMGLDILKGRIQALTWVLRYLGEGLLHIKQQKDATDTRTRPAKFFDSLREHTWGGFQRESTTRLIKQVTALQEILRNCSEQIALP